jgi:hypothetical protein
MATNLTFQAGRLESIGRMLWLESGKAWDHTPEYEGFRPVFGMR